MILIPAVIAAGCIAVLALVGLVLRFLQVRKQMSACEIIFSERLANFYGLSSLGPGQLRGNGWLALTKDSLMFKMYFPAKSLTIPLETINRVEAVRTHLGKTGKAGSSLLRISYLSGEHEEAAAWNVDHTVQWIEGIRANGRTDLFSREGNRHL
ncbi:hypothetical protein BSK56_32485 [Paenibacillus borealis]|uniref:DUF2550 domain-containing protein n=2 Tax=Paenibacillus TaxID=44249 RepID=A0ABX3GSE1_PAEBO|nr:hypothetical protein BSK56_32485 [Paenibacillus borealis]